MHNRNSNVDVEENSDANNADGGKPVVVGLFSVFDAESKMWEVLECDVDSVVKDVNNTGCDDCDGSGEMSFEAVADSITENHGLVIGDDVVRFAVEEAQIKEYGDVRDVDDCKKALYLMKKKAEMKSINRVNDSLGGENKNVLNPRVLISNTYRSIKHLAGKFNTHLITHRENVKDKLNNDSTKSE